MQNKSIGTQENIFLITGINESFLQKAEGFIKSMENHSNVKNIVITLDFSAPKDFCTEYPNIEFIYLSSNEVKAPNPNTCLQHGGFLPAVKHLSDDAIMIFTDADISVQRGFTGDELRMLSSLTEQDIAVGYNAAPSQTLIQEVENLEPRLTAEEIREKYPNAEWYSVFNTGVLVAKKKTYQQLYEHYIQNWVEINKALGHYAKQQWLLSYLIQKHFNVKILTDEVHTHDHHPIELKTFKSGVDALKNMDTSFALKTPLSCSLIAFRNSLTQLSGIEK